MGHKGPTSWAFSPRGQPIEQREQSDACINYAEPRQRKAEGLTQNGFAIEQSGAFGTATQNGRSSERRSNACIDYAELTTNREQSDACIDYAEVRRKKTKSTVTDEKNT